MSKGYVYVMINSSYEGLVKVGKTTKSPNERAKELSCATGVPTPFVVVYYREFYNCDKAELIAHEILSEKGYRVNSSREFFAINTTDAINIILSISDNIDDEASYQNAENINESDICEYYFNEAEKYYYGLDGYFQDKDLALFNYEKSASLGYKYAYRRIGIILKNNNLLEAIRSFQNGVKSGDMMCYAELGDIYMQSYHQYYNEYNATLSWSKYFEFAENQYIINNTWDQNHEIVDYICTYLIWATKPGECLNQQHELFLNKFNSQIAERIHYHINLLKIKYPMGDMLIHKFEKALSYLVNLEEKSLISVHDDFELALNYFNIAERYYLGVGREVGYIKALNYYKKSDELGFYLSKARIGSIWILKGNLEKAYQYWDEYCDIMYGKDLNPEEMELFMRGITIIVNCIIDNNIDTQFNSKIMMLIKHYNIYNYCANKMNITYEKRYQQSMIDNCIQNMYRIETMNNITKFITLYA